MESQRTHKESNTVKKRMFLRIALAALLSAGMYALAAPAAQAAPPTSHTVLHESGLSAAAHYSGEYTAASGMVSWSVDYAIMTGTTQTSSPSVWAHISEFQTPEQSFNAFGETPVPASAVQIDKKLNTAALLAPVDVTVTVQDGNALEWGTEITLHIAPTDWTGIGAITTGSFTYHERSATYSVVYHSTGRSRDATVEGDFSYTAPWNNVAISAADATSIFGSLNDSRSMTVSIERA